jgi:hypothetical protein
MASERVVDDETLAEWRRREERGRARERQPREALVIGIGEPLSFEEH